MLNRILYKVIKLLTKNIAYLILGSLDIKQLIPFKFIKLYKSFRFNIFLT